MIRHFTKSGKEIKSVEGIVIKPEDFPELYRIFEKVRIQEMTRYEKTNKEQSH